MKSVLSCACCFLIASGTTTYGQNLVTLNPGAETGDLTGWDSGHDVTINSNLLYVTEGLFSFNVHNEHLTSTPANRVPINVDVNYALSFDALVLGDPNYPLLQLRFFEPDLPGVPVIQSVYDLNDPGAFSATAPTANGFTKYTLNIHFVSGGPSPPPDFTYMELDFPNPTYVDNIQLAIVPEVSTLTFFGIATLILLARRLTS